MTDDPWSVTKASPEDWSDRLHAAFDGGPVGMAFIGLDGRILRANRALAALLGWETADLSTTSFRALIHPDEAEGKLPIAWLLLAGNLGACQTEHRLIRRDQSVIWVQINASLVRDNAGRPVCFTAHVQDISERRAHEDRLRHRALHDPLTGLPNRTNFIERLTRALSAAARQSEAVAVVLVDLDGFKAVNDALGHDAGDRLLMAVGQRLAACLRSGDTAARIGGDEFALLVQHVRASRDAVAVAERVVAGLRAPVMIGTREVTISPSLGVALSGMTGTGQDELLRAADMALYRAKASGRGTYAVAEVRMDQGAGDVIDLPQASSGLHDTPSL